LGSKLAFSIKPTSLWPLSPSFGSNVLFLSVTHYAGDCLSCGERLNSGQRLNSGWRLNSGERLNSGWRLKSGQRLNSGERLYHLSPVALACRIVWIEPPNALLQ
jgi:hypothetical protein